MQALPYWIEHDENNNPKNYVWVKVPEIKAGTNKIYIYKKNGFKPNGEAVFDFFDDFDDNIYTNKWDEIISSTNNAATPISEINSNIVFTVDNSTSHAGSGIVSKSTLAATSWIIEGYGKRVTGFKAGEWGLKFSLTDKTGIPDVGYGAYSSWAAGNIMEYISKGYRMNAQYKVTNETAINSVGSTATFEPWDGIWVRVTVFYLHDTKQVKARFVYSNTDKMLGPGTAGSSNLSIVYIQLHYADASITNAQSFIDWVGIRKYSPNEPTVKVKRFADYYEILIDSTVDISDYQIAVPILELDISSINESLYISQYKKPSKTWMFSLGGILKNFKTNSYIEAVMKKSLDSNIMNETTKTTTISTNGNTEVVDTIIKNAASIVGTTQQLSNALGDTINIQKSIQDMLSSIANLSHISSVNSAVDVEMLQDISNNLSSSTEVIQTLLEDISVLNDVALLTIIREHASILNELLSTNNYNTSAVIENIKEIEQAYSKLIDTAAATETKLSCIQNNVNNLQKQLNEFVEIMKTEEFNTTTTQELVNSVERKVSVFNELVETIDQLIIKLRTVIEKANVYRTSR